MQENEFEKQVRQKMDEVKLHPSDAVWQKIEGQIKKEKRRRWGLILFPLVCLGVLYGGYLLMNRTNPISQLQPKASTHTNEKNIASNKQKANFDSAKNNHPFIDIKETQLQDVSSKTKPGKKIKTKPGLKIRNEFAFITNSKLDTPIVKTINETSKRITEDNKINSSVNSSDEKLITEVVNKPDNILKTEVELIADTLERKKETITAEETISPIEKKSSIKNKSKWDWGVTFSAGISGKSDLFLANGQKSFGPSNSGGLGGGNIPTPSLIKSGYGFITGISAEKAISAKTKFVTGLHYKLFSTKNMVGADSASFYTVFNDINTYHNLYHFIELPVGFRFQLNNSNKIKLFVNSGLSVSRLITSNGLQFNTNTGIYYKDNSLFNKTHLGFNAGIDIAFSSKQNRSFLVGPYLNYGISKLAKEGYNKYHLSFVGIKAQLFFKKK